MMIAFATEVPRTPEEYREWWRRERPDTPYGYCWCGCGSRTKPARRNERGKPVVKGEPLRYIHGHNATWLPPAPETRPLAERFWEKVVKREDGCWVWTGFRTALGYGRIYKGGKSKSMLFAHRAAYELLVGELPPGTELDHLCRNPSCVNPAHLEPVSHRENVLRGNHPTAILHREGTCKNGHPYALHAQRRSNGNVAYCRICRNERRRKEVRERRPEAGADYAPVQS